MPTVALAVLALIPGVLDEAALGLGALAFAVLAKLLRQYPVKNRQRILNQLLNAAHVGQLTHQDLAQATQALNSVTVPGGE